MSVMWLGPVQNKRHGQGPFYACDPCMRRLEDRVAEFAARRDFPACNPRPGCGARARSRDGPDHPSI
ncbi:hypothetical protein P8A19_41030 [Streptomyces poriferorum]|uniref:Uncharacterized protein n=1 Tax=Streptomyces poriferorum TaxID=2798799 RepID=A0ABY9J301_9ACTN|nr:MULTISPECIES: hypothetical protein [unclassified Streptomyces]MDP5309398.1 hypothetical protein [Streptomyces sp. Alt4]WLQ61965.1 hypothetical protein P8A19_41030 [Streptomyces sp. Alt2]